MSESSVGTNVETPAFLKTMAASGAKVGRRMVAIDAVRGFIMVCMAVDHVRETFFLHHQVTDPMDILMVSPGVFFTRLVSEICAPVFILLAGLSAWLYGQSHTKSDVSSFLIKRGLFLILLEVTVVNFGWTAKFPPDTLWLQVIWCIGLCMLALSALIYLPRALQIAVAIIIIFGHNLLDGVTLSEQSPFFPIWAILHQRAYLAPIDGIKIHVTYPVLPWIGVILAGYAIGPLFARDSSPERRQSILISMGLGLLAMFVLIRYANVYGEKPWMHGQDILHTLMSFLSTTKYPPSLMFLLPNIGLGLLLLAGFERIDRTKFSEVLAVLGGAPMFFYLLHIYVLKILYLCAVGIWGLTQGNVFGFEHLWAIWVWVPLLVIPLYFPTRWFSRLKQSRRDLWVLKYF